MEELVKHIITIAKLTDDYDLATKQITDLIKQEINSRIAACAKIVAIETFDVWGDVCVRGNRIGKDVLSKMKEKLIP